MRSPVVRQVPGGCGAAVRSGGGLRWVGRAAALLWAGPPAHRSRRVVLRPPPLDIRQVSPPPPTRAAWILTAILTAGSLGWGGHRLDILINNACQTIRRPAAYYQHMIGGERAAADQAEAAALQVKKPRSFHHLNLRYHLLKQPGFW